MAKYILAFKDEHGRALVSISSNHISFNISGHKEFDSVEAAEAFLLSWQHHFFHFDTLEIIPSPNKTTHRTW